jgi:hypothetical protein
MQTSLRAKILVGIAVAIAGYVLFGPDDAQTAETAKSSDRPHTLRTTHGAESRAHRADTSQALFSLTHRVSAATSAEALFASHSWYTPPPPPPPAPAPVLTAAQEAALRAPVAPPLPYAFMGSYTVDGAEPVLFLTRGDRVYSVKVGDSLDETYSVDSLSNGQLVLTYKPLKIQQQLTIGSAP